jgi:hypothetical protein
MTAAYTFGVLVLSERRPPCFRSPWRRSESSRSLALALVLGVIATAWGLGFAVYLGAAAIAIVSLATLVLAATMGGP